MSDMEKPKEQLLSCKDCDHSVIVKVTSNRDNWPLHKCRATRKAAPFTKAVDVPKMPVRAFPPEEPRQPVTDPYPYLKVIG